MANRDIRDIFLFSGLGADERVFEFLDLGPHRIHHVQWTQPETGEAIDNYARRLLPQITSDDPILIGVSFGGIMAIEVAKLIQARKVILISSARTKSEIPLTYKLGHRLGFINLVPAGWLKVVNPLTFWFFGTESEAERKLLSSIITEMDDQFLLWAIKKILSWKNQVMPSNLTLIHGANDRILPNKNPDIRIANAGHFMIVNKAKELNPIILDLLK